MKVQVTKLLKKSCERKLQSSEFINLCHQTNEHTKKKSMTHHLDQVLSQYLLCRSIHMIKNALEKIKKQKNLNQT